VFLLSKGFCPIFKAQQCCFFLKVGLSALGINLQGGGQKRKLFSEKTEKTWRKRKRKLLLEGDLFSRKRFSGENPKIYFLLDIILHRTNMLNMGPKLGCRPKNAIHTLYNKVTDKAEINS
jgi:hypothetical protein